MSHSASQSVFKRQNNNLKLGGAEHTEVKPSRNNAAQEVRSMSSMNGKLDPV